MIAGFAVPIIISFYSGVATVYAIKSAGLAMGVGIGSSCIVVSSFSWGIFFFHEKVRSVPGACLAVTCLILGLFGMSYATNSSGGSSSSSSATTNILNNNDRVANPAILLNNSTKSEEEEEDDMGTKRIRRLPRIGRMHSSGSLGSTGSASKKASLGTEIELTVSERSVPGAPVRISFSQSPVQMKKRSGINRDVSREYVVSKPISYSGGNAGEMDAEVMALWGNSAAHALLPKPPGETVLILGREIPRRNWGMFLAAVFGLWGGSVMAPMKLCPSDIQGFRFVISFAIGSSIVNVVFWLLRYFYNVYRHKSLSKAFANLPSFHLDVMWRPGGLSGLLWSIGNFFSLTSVKYLGQGVGYPLVQSQLLISGLWGIFLFKEVPKEQIPTWMCSALVLLFGILFLSYQHVD